MALLFYLTYSDHVATHLCVCVFSGAEDGSVRLEGGDRRYGVVEVAYNGC